MMSSRSAILSRISKALDRTATETAQTPAAVSARLAKPNTHTLPALPANLTQLLVDQMESVQISVERIQTSKGIVAAVQWYLQSLSIDGSVKVAPALKNLHWPAGYTQGAASGDELTAVTPCLLAVAETGSLVLSSTADTPTTLNFLPDNHIVVLYESQIVGHIEEVWGPLRALDPLPRAVNFATGPSRTADIEQTIEIGISN